MARPEFLITPEVLKKAEHYASLGLTQEQVANCLGISDWTLYDKKVKNPEFSRAIKRGLDKGIQRMANRLVKQSKKGNTAATIFFLKARAKWSDNAAVDELHAKIDALIGAQQNGNFKRGETKEDT